MCILYTVSPGYVIAFNATEYEFDVNVYSPNGTVVFEALIFAENSSSLVTMGAAFGGTEAYYGPYSINGMDVTAEVLPIGSNNLLTIRIDGDGALDPNDNETVYEFTISAFADTPYTELLVNTILHEIGKCFAKAI